MGGLGFGCSGNIGQKLAVFEPGHGSAPKYAGLYKVNPIAAILSAKMMLDWLGRGREGCLYRAGDCCGDREKEKFAPYDMGGTHTTIQMGEAIAAKL